MLSNLLLHVIKANIKAQYYYRMTAVFELISIVIALTIYYFTSLAFEPAVASKISEFQTSYFNYIIIGDIFLAIPLYFLEAPFRNLRVSAIEGTWQTLMSLPVGKFKSFTVIGLMDLPRTMARALITLILAVVIFGLKFKASWFLLALVLQLAAIPLCFGLGTFVASVFILTGRGQALVGYLSTISAFFAGALFPIAVFPAELAKLSLLLSPFTLLLENTRKVLSGSSLDLNVVFIIFVWGLVMPISWKFFAWSLDKRKDSGDNYLLI